jgi:hypothetical protein
MSQSLNKILMFLIFTGGLLLPLYVSAEYIALENAAEAGEIRVIWQQQGKTGVVHVKECEACPLKLEVDANTIFLSHGREIRRDKVNSYSGKPGTAIYDKQGKHALRILW